MQHYNVNMDTYIWHYHNRPEGGLRIFDPKPYVPAEKYIPITAAMLTDFANKGQWGVTYPHGAQEAEAEQQKNRNKSNALYYILLAILFGLLLFIYLQMR